MTDCSLNVSGKASQEIRLCVSGSVVIIATIAEVGIGLAGRFIGSS